MKVQLKEGAPVAGPGGPGRWLRQGVSYAVLAIEAGGRGQHQYRIADEVEQTPALFEARLFEIVDGRLPSNWIVVAHGEHLEFQPAAWTTPGFWENFFDGDATATRIYEQELDEISR